MTTAPETMQQGQPSDAHPQGIRIWPWLSRLAGVVLLAVGVAKVVNAFSDGVRHIANVDPVFGLKIWQMFLAVGAVEIGIGGMCIWRGSKPPAGAFLAWLASSMVLYRFGLWWLGSKRPCQCMAGLAEVFSLEPAQADTIMMGVLVFLLVVGYGSLFTKTSRVS